jgi:hypothetical protein
MVSQCANPECETPFLYLREGRLFATSHRSSPAEESRVEYFWLCASCAPRMKLVASEDGGMDLVPCEEAVTQRKSA